MSDVAWRCCCSSPKTIAFRRVRFTRLPAWAGAARSCLPGYRASSSQRRRSSLGRSLPLKTSSTTVTLVSHLFYVLTVHFLLPWDKPCCLANNFSCSQIDNTACFSWKLLSAFCGFEDRAQLQLFPLYSTLLDAQRDSDKPHCYFNNASAAYVITRRATVFRAPRNFEPSHGILRNSVLAGD